MNMNPFQINDLKKFDIYHNFNCHSKVKGYFSKNRITEDGEKSLEKAKQALINKGMYDDAYKDIFYFLAGAFTESHAISIIGKIPSCMHINYLLNTEFESTYQNVDKTKFEIFKEFTDIFFSDYNSKYNTCSPYMKYLENDDFYKMKTLYTLYDQYEKFTNDIKPNNNTLCFYLSILRDNYYLLLNKYDGKEHNDELLDKLKMFKELLRTEFTSLRSMLNKSIHKNKSHNKKLKEISEKYLEYMNK
ncbi:hypothetical protein PVIIG_05251 [Plasmodium vivax India VII]|uniref:Uncharacterized protein n=1 Tax=Plasmodium vivax India VII TaxID=1077284 RepID=A0A0J9SK09_PLAVI|nr:hypothetical protein PVIIG_05251 [Plasmodium vivax India VII]